jgi:hypothetical protein
VVVRKLIASVTIGVCASSACRQSRDAASADSLDLTLAPAGHTESIRPLRRSVAPCLAYEDTVQLTGTLTRITYPGPPNYERVADGDEAETGFYLTLQSVICARAAIPNPNDASIQAQDSVRRVQLVLDSAGYARLGPSIGRTVTVRGTIFGAHTSHHHARILLDPSPVGR